MIQLTSNYVGFAWMPCADEFHIARLERAQNKALPRRISFSGPVVKRINRDNLRNKGRELIRYFQTRYYREWTSSCMMSPRGWKSRHLEIYPQLEGVYSQMTPQRRKKATISRIAEVNADLTSSTDG